MTQEQILKMNQAYAFVKRQEFSRGALIYDNLAKTLKDPSSKSLALFNAGSAYRSANQCKKALSRYRQLLDHSLQQPSFRARGLMEISFVYECLGNRELAFVSLQDLEPFLSSLPWFLSQMVYPARLALAQARLGKMVQAENYKSLSLTRILQSKEAFSSEKELNEQMSRLFYLMGRSYVKKEYMNSEAFFNAFSYHQLYLLQSLFLKDKLWSSLSKRELQSLFDKLLFALSKFEEKKKYKKLLLQNIREARILIQKEKSIKWEKFYFKNSQPIVKLLSQPL